ncbi:MAG: phosphate ABC transporter permease PstA [Acidobacteriota bacterium]|jgi:phosphate transport system permease protein
MRLKSKARRKASDLSIKVFSTFSALLGIFFLGWILYVVIQRGAAALNWNFFTQLPAPPGTPGGGLASAILGTLYMTVIAGVVGVPTGMLAGVYLSEYGQRSRFGAWVRFTVNVMMGIPSIIMGLFIYTLMVVPFGHFSGYAGGMSLALLILPIVARTTEDMLTLVPNSMRESALALGAPRWRVTLGIVFRAARVGLITGVLLAVARVSGETAPLLFTSLNSPYWPKSLSQPTSNLTVTIFNYAMSPYNDWQQAAWGASLLIMVGVLSMTVLARLTLTGKKS